MLVGCGKMGFHYRPYIHIYVIRCITYQRVREICGDLVRGGLTLETGPGERLRLTLDRRRIKTVSHLLLSVTMDNKRQLFRITYFCEERVSVSLFSDVYCVYKRSCDSEITHESYRYE